MTENEQQGMLELLWRAYKKDKDPEWLKPMLGLRVFENTPVPNEIAEEIFYHLSEHIYKRPKKRKNYDRDEQICELYATLHPRYRGTFKLAAIRDVAGNFPDLSEESVRTILRRKWIWDQAKRDPDFPKPVRFSNGTMRFSAEKAAEYDAKKLVET